MVKATQKAALAHGFSGKITAEKMAGENLKYPDNFADLVFGHSVLHHTELKLSRDEIHRVLRPKGRAVFLEPLAHNPLISIFRKVTPSRRTPTEKPWLFSDVSFFSEPFCNVRHREFYFLALAAFMFSALGNERLFRGAMERLSRLDGKLFSIWPALRRYAWVTVIEVTK
jgi:SAM-dependent methyltransferase